MKRFWDTIEIGREEALGSHLFEAEEIVSFARRYDPQPFHLDAEKAESSLLGGLCASGWHTTAVFMKLNVAAHRRHAELWLREAGEPPRFGPSPGIRSLKWPKPVMAGDRISYRRTLTGKRESRSMPGWGIVDFSATAVNQRGETVLSFEASAFVGTE